MEMTVQKKVDASYQQRSRAYIIQKMLIRIPARIVGRDISVGTATRYRLVKGKVQPRTGHEGPEGE